MSERTGIWLVLLTAVISGFSIFINSYGVRGFDSSVFTFSKNLLVALLLLGILLGVSGWKELKGMSRKQWGQLSLIGLVGGSVPFLLFFRGLQMTTGAMGSFIHKLLFLFVAVFAMVFLREKITKGLFIGALMLLAGNALLIRPGFSFSGGHILILLATLLWAAEHTYAKRVLRELSGTVVAFGRMAFGSVFLLLFLAATGKLAMVRSMSAAQYGWIGVTSLFLLLYVLTFYNGLKRVKASTAACILALGSPLTTLLSWAFSGAPLQAAHLAGILLVGGGVAAVIRMDAPWTHHERA